MFYIGCRCFCYESIKYCLNVLDVAFFYTSKGIFSFISLFFHLNLRTDCVLYVFIHATFNSNDIYTYEYVFREIFMHILERGPFYFFKMGCRRVFTK